MKIKKATKKDLKEIAKLMRTEFAKPPFKEKASLNAVLKSLNFYMKIGKIYTAQIKQKIIGIIIFKEEQFWKGRIILIEDLAIDEKVKKQGIGKKLVNYVESHAKKRKAKFIGFITHKKSNAVKFYQKQGYKIKKDSIIMRKDIK